MGLNYLLIGFIVIISSASANAESAPALLWSRTSLPASPSLKDVDQAAFNAILNDAFGSSKPLVVVFMEDNLSNEDFSVRGSDEQYLYDNLKAAIGDNNILYLPSVSNSENTPSILKKYDEVWYNGEVPTDLQNPTVLMVPLHDEVTELRSANLQSHFNTIQTVYKELTKSYKHVMAIYTGRRNSWADAYKSIKRSRRADEPQAPPAPLLIRHEGLVAVATAISFKKDEKDDAVTVTGIGAVTVTNATSSILLKAALLPSGEITFVLQTIQSRQWVLQSIMLEDKELVPRDLDTWAPVGWSWACNGMLTFRASPVGGAAHSSSINITGLQIQPDVGENNKFGQAMDCVPYFSMPIWTGLAVSVLLLAILSWGLMMLMDINTNDRFDDPKGKTITISATD